MNLIPCSEQCKHQKEGYCGFDEAGVISQQLGTGLTGCVYFAGKDKPVSKSLPKEFDSFGNG